MSTISENAPGADQERGAPEVRHAADQSALPQRALVMRDLMAAQLAGLADATATLKQPPLAQPARPSMAPSVTAHPVTAQSALAQHRARSAAAFREQGFPGNKVEAWRFTSLRALLATPFQVEGDPTSPIVAGDVEGETGALPAGDASAPVSVRETAERAAFEAARQRARQAYGASEGVRVLCVAGRFVGVDLGAVALEKVASEKDGREKVPAKTEQSLPPGLRASDLRARLEQAPAAESASSGSVAAAEASDGSAKVETSALQKSFAAIAPANPFENLNTALFQGGLLLEIDPDVQLDCPIEIVRLWPAPGHVCQRRTLVLVGDRSKVSLIERELATPELSADRNGAQSAKAETSAAFVNPAAFVNEVSEWVLGAGARVEHQRVFATSARDYHIVSQAVRQSADAELTSKLVALGGKLTRANIRTELAGAGARARFFGAQAAGQGEQVDCYLFIDHAASHTHSEQLFRSLVGRHGKIVYDGVSKVRAGTAVVEAHQDSKTVLLHEDGTVHTKPHLEIDAEEVSCSHGATVGALDEEALFYLRARGISESVARELLLRGFLQQAVATVASEFVEPYLSALAGNLRSGAVEGGSVVDGGGSQ